MKTKLVITIRVDDSLDKTLELVEKCMSNDKIKIKDIFNDEAEVCFNSVSDIYSEPFSLSLEMIKRGRTLKEPQSTKLELLMVKRR